MSTTVITCYTGPMGRWVPDAQGRLIQAAMDLYSEHGYEQTTVSEIAGRAGLAERTFYRYFTDKREVLFFGSERLESWIAEGIERAPVDRAPMDTIGASLEGVAAFFTDGRSHPQRRQAVIDANPELRERERNKLAALAIAIAAALQRRGAKELTAQLAAEMGVAVFKSAFERWIHEPEERDLVDYIRESLAELKAITAGR
jgi:AcrR family transcriptional regulator